MFYPGSNLSKILREYASSNFFSSPLAVLIKSSKKLCSNLNERVSVVDLVASRYVRIDELELVYNGVPISIIEKCESTRKLLQQFAQKLIGSKLHFRACIDNTDLSSFNDHFELLDHIENRLLPLCNLCRAYKFEVEFRFDSGAAESVISSLLQMTPIIRCFNVKMLFYFVHSPTQLPMEGIINWLTDNSNGNHSEKKKILQIDIASIINVYETFRRILQVSYINRYATFCRRDVLMPSIQIFRVVLTFFLSI